jgi:hypothetical protein
MTPTFYTATVSPVPSSGRSANHHWAFVRFASHLIHRHILDPARLPPLLRALRGALFPNNAPGTPTLVPPSSDAELAALRRKCARALGSLLPTWTTRLYFRGGRFWRANGAVGPTGDLQGDPDRPDDQQCNRAGRNGLATEAYSIPLDEDVVQQIEDTVLDVFSDEYCNKHLMYSVLELILVRLMPELVEKGVAELWDERLS